MTALSRDISNHFPFAEDVLVTSHRVLGMNESDAEWRVKI